MNAVPPPARTDAGSTAAAARGVIGDFLFALGPAADDCLRGLAGFALARDGDAGVATRGAVHRGAVGGDARWLALADLVDGEPGAGAAALLDGGELPHARWRGRFAQLAWHAGERRVAAATDPFSTLPLYVLERDGTLLLASDLRLLAATPLCRRETDPLAIYHYLNFGFVPAPYTICRDVRRLTPGTRFAWRDGIGTHVRYFLPTYPADLDGGDDALATQLRERIVASVHDYRPAEADAWGCFLSGGTDSSSIVSILSRQRPERRVRTFSIGFAESGYDELGYAELVAAQCGADAATARVDRAQTLDLLDVVVDAYDQPFGDASAVPTLACAALAASRKVDALVAGDGGDEIFGGNSRYAKDQVMQAFYRLPAPLKRAGRALGRLAGRSPSHLLNRVQNFTERASLPNPDRFYEGDSFGSDYYATLLTDAFRAQAPRDASLEFMRSVHALGEPAEPLHRIMRLDLLMAIAQNDLVKVEGACRAYGISARFPYLDPRLVEFTGRLPQRCKVRGLTKRYLFKKAMVGILPNEVLRKKKQGFGLPIAVWLRSDPAFQRRVHDVLFDPRTARRGIFATAFVEHLLAEHARGSWDHSRGIWQMLVLELWLRKHLDA